METRQVPRAGDRELRHRAVRGPLRDGNRTAEQPAERRAQRAADAIRLGKGPSHRGRLGLIGVGGYHVYKGVSKKFLKDLRVSGGTGITAVGVIGYVAKGLVLAGAGILVIVATLQADPSKAPASTPRSRRSVRPRSASPLILAALGIAAFGAYVSPVASAHARCVRRSRRSVEPATSGCPAIPSRSVERAIPAESRATPPAAPGKNVLQRKGVAELLDAATVGVPGAVDRVAVTQEHVEREALVGSCVDVGAERTLRRGVPLHLLPTLSR